MSPVGIGARKLGTPEEERARDIDLITDGGKKKAAEFLVRRSFHLYGKDWSFDVYCTVADPGGALDAFDAEVVDPRSTLDLLVDGRVRLSRVSSRPMSASPPPMPTPAIVRSAKALRARAQKLSAKVERFALLAAQATAAADAAARAAGIQEEDQ